MLHRLREHLAIRAARRSTRHLGSAGEAVAARHLRRAGFRILGRNLNVPMGEADLLCLAPDRRTIVLVEVKTRDIPAGRDAAFLPPESAITAEKRDKLRAILRHLRRANAWLDRPARIDVIAVDWFAHGPPAVRHHPDAVSTR